MKTKMRCIFFYNVGNEVICYVRVIRNKTDNIRIGRVVTHKDFRGQKLSSNLMKEAMKFISKNHSDKIIALSAQEHLQQFYGKFGFLAISEMYLEDGIPHVAMEFKG